MSLPDKTAVQSMDYGSDGSPHVIVPAKASIDLNTLDYGDEGSPLWGPGDTTPPPAPARKAIMFIIT